MHKELPNISFNNPSSKFRCNQASDAITDSRLSRVAEDTCVYPAEDICVHPFQLALLFIFLILATVFAKIQHEKYGFAI
jgi:hypothetical protein